MSISFGVIKHLKENFDCIIVSNMLIPTGIIAINYMNKNKINYIFQSEGGFIETKKALKERINRKILSKAKIYLSGMKYPQELFHAIWCTKRKFIPLSFYFFFKREILYKPLLMNEKEVI